MERRRREGREEKEKRQGVTWRLEGGRGEKERKEVGRGWHGDWKEAEVRKRERK